jgi:chain length determinant protein tyrosine kinase EpsG
MNTSVRGKGKVRKLETERAEERIGDKLRQSGKLTEEDVSRIVAVQRQQNIRFGEAAVNLSLVTTDDIQMALASQYSYPYAVPHPAAGNSALYAATDPFGAGSEAIRTVRTQLLCASLGEKYRSLVVTSSHGGEGTSVLAANLAISFAQLGERTLLVDANFRRPMQHDLFDLHAGLGLSKLLSGRCSLEEVMVPVPPFATLSVLCAGAVPPNPQELLSQIAFSYLMETAPTTFDIVIIDTPPILDFSDALIATTRAGAYLLSARVNKTKITELAKAKALLASTGAKLMGAVVTDA